MTQPRLRIEGAWQTRLDEGAELASDYNFALAVYDGPASARAVFNILEDLQKEKALDIKEAAVLTRAPSGKITMSNLGYVGLIGFTRSGDRRKLKLILDEQLGADQSALAIVIKRADWSAVAEATRSYPGEIVMSEMSNEALAALEDMASDEDFAEAKAAVIDV